MGERENAHAPMLLVVLFLAPILVPCLIFELSKKEPPQPTARLCQWVVWDKTDPEAPAHYVNYSDGGYAASGYTAACGKHLPSPIGSTEFATLEQMEAEKRVPCKDCVKALEAFKYAGITGVHPDKK